jgi:hypothetical protein
MGEWMYRSLILDLGTSWRWVVSFTPRLLYPRGKSPRYPLDRRLGGPQSRSRRRGEENILNPTEPSVVQPATCWLQCVGVHEIVCLWRQGEHTYQWPIEFSSSYTFCGGSGKTEKKKKADIWNVCYRSESPEYLNLYETLSVISCYNKHVCRIQIIIIFLTRSL